MLYLYGVCEWIGWHIVGTKYPKQFQKITINQKFHKFKKIINNALPWCDALALCPGMLDLIEARGHASLDDRFAEIFEIINQKIKSKNAFTMRPYFIDIADVLMAYTVLKKPSIVVNYHDIFSQDCVSGKLSKYVLEISKNHSWFNEQIYSIAGSPDDKLFKLIIIFK